MSLLPRRWRLRRLRGRLTKVERAKDVALQALIVRDQTVADRPRYDFQDPGVVGSMLDEIAGLRARIALLDPESERPAAESPSAPAGPASRPPKLAPPAASPAAHRPEEVVDAAFHVLRHGLAQAAGNGRIGATALRDALHAALASEEVLEAAFAALQAEMLRLQRSIARSKLGLDQLREALRSALAADEPAEPVWDGTWPDLDRPGLPADPVQDGWHWAQAPGKPMVALSWHADTRCWGHRAGISARKIFEDGVRYYGPCAPPVLAVPVRAEKLSA